MLVLVAPLVFRAPEGPAAVCAGGRRPARESSALRASLGASSRSPARPRHRPPAPRQVPPAPSTPAAQPEFVIELVACGSAGVPGAVGPGRPRDRHTRASLGVVDLEARPCPPDPPAPSTPVVPGVLTCGSVRVVTNVVNSMAFSVKMLVFGLGLTTFVTEVLARRFESCWFDDVCNVGRPLVARPGPATVLRTSAT